MADWIAVSERLPESSDPVLARCTFPGGLHPVTAIVQYGAFEYYDMGNDYDVIESHGWYDEREDSGEYDIVITPLGDGVTHWMELPDPPVADQLGERK